MTTPAVLYAAKSTEDVHESIPTQLADGGEMAADNGWTVVGQYQDEGFSAYSGNRGPGLANARRHAAEAAAANGTVCMLISQHSDRFSRGAGDKPKAAEALIEIWHAERRRDVHLRSVEDDLDLRDSASVANIGERNRADSARKSKSVRKGLKRRKDAGKPVGALPDGYRVETTIGADGKPVTRRVIDDTRRTLVERIVDGIEARFTTGQVARGMNADGLRTGRGKQWSARGVRDIALNEDYTGTTGYPKMIEPARHTRIVELVHRSDVVARKGGRHATEPYLLRGMGTCAQCDAPLYTRRLAAGRHYVCRNVRESRGTCDALPIPAERVEAAVVDHLHRFVEDVEGWIAERARAASTERDAFAAAVDEERAVLRTIRVRGERAHAQHARLLDDDDPVADDALREAVRIDREADELAATITAADARLAEWPTAVEVDTALDFYRDPRDAIAGRIDTAETIIEANAALRIVLQNANLAIRDGALWGEFFVRNDAGMRTGCLGGLDGDLADNKIEFYPDDVPADELAEFRRSIGRTERQTLV